MYTLAKMAENDKLAKLAQSKKRNKKSINFRPSIVLVDDDPIFGGIVRRVADKMGVSVVHINGLKELDSVNLSHFDVAIVDYYLDNLNGLEMTEIIEDQCRGVLPVVLISGTRRQRTTPEGVNAFVPKDKGVEAIIQKAIEVRNEQYS